MEMDRCHSRARENYSGPLQMRSLLNSLLNALLHTRAPTWTTGGSAIDPLACLACCVLRVLWRRAARSGARAHPPLRCPRRACMHARCPTARRASPAPCACMRAHGRVRPAARARMHQERAAALTTQPWSPAQSSLFRDTPDETHPPLRFPTLAGITCGQGERPRRKIRRRRRRAALWPRAAACGRGRRWRGAIPRRRATDWAGLREGPIHHPDGGTHA